MASNILLVDYNGINTQADAYKKQGTAFAAIKTKMISITASLPEAWKGQQKEIFEATYTKALGILDTTKSNCDTVAKQMKQYATEMKNADSSQAKKITSAF